MTRVIALTLAVDGASPSGSLLPPKLSARHAKGCPSPLNWPGTDWQQRSCERVVGCIKIPGAERTRISYLIPLELLTGFMLPPVETEMVEHAHFNAKLNLFDVKE